MTCRDFWSQMPELDTAPERFDHLRECTSCAGLMERQRVLAVGLRHLAGKRAALESPPRIEAQLLEAFRRYSGTLTKPGRPWWVLCWKWAPAAAATVAFGGWLVWSHRTGPIHSLPATAAYAAVAVDDAADADNGFIPLPYAADTVSTDEADRVRVELPRSALVALGVPVAEGDGDAVQAELLLGAGGAPQAVKLLQ